MTKVDRRILKSQEAIKKAVFDLMSEKNFDDITIQDISDRANVSRGKIYLHYLDKYYMLNKLIEEYINKLWRATIFFGSVIKKLGPAPPQCKRLST